MSGFHIEVKFAKTAPDIWKAIEQSEDDKPENEQTLVFHKKNGKPWLATMLADDFMNVMVTEVFPEQE